MICSDLIPPKISFYFVHPLKYYLLAQLNLTLNLLQLCPAVFINFRRKAGFSRGEVQMMMMLMEDKILICAVPSLGGD